MTATRVSRSPVLARNVHRDGEGLRSSREVSLWVKGQEQINRVHGQAQAGLVALQQPNLTFCPHPQHRRLSPGWGSPRSIMAASAPQHHHGRGQPWAAVVLSWPQAQGGNPRPLPHALLCDSSRRTWKSLLHSIIMWAKPCVAARFSLSSLWSGFPRLYFLWLSLWMGKAKGRL